MPNDILYLLLVIVIAAVVLWGLTQFPLDPALLRIIRVLVIVFVVIYVIYALFGLLGNAPRHRTSLRPETSSPGKFLLVDRMQRAETLSALYDHR